MICNRFFVILFCIFFFAMHLDSSAQNFKTASFGAGCFWCVEAIFDALNGVENVDSGYMGGSIENPTYKQVCSGTTGHAEIVHITFDSQVIEFKQLLEVFFKVHDPTTLNRQGGDVGTQYRSVIFYHSDEQKQIADDIINVLEEHKVYENPITTTLEKAQTFYKAEEYHQDYYRLNKNRNPYCSNVITPKFEKFKSLFSTYLK